MPESSLRNTVLTALTALVFGFLGAAIWSYAGLADNRTRAFLLDNPDMLPQMVEAYEAQEAEKRLAAMGDQVFTLSPAWCWAIRKARRCWSNSPTITAPIARRA
jgi:hypothetical protein